MIIYDKKRPQPWLEAEANNLGKNCLIFSKNSILINLHKFFITSLLAYTYFDFALV